MARTTSKSRNLAPFGSRPALRSGRQPHSARHPLRGRQSPPNPFGFRAMRLGSDGKVKGALAAAMRPRRFNRAGVAVALSAPRRSTCRVCAFCSLSMAITLTVLTRRAVRSTGDAFHKG